MPIGIDGFAGLNDCDSRMRDSGLTTQIGQAIFPDQPLDRTACAWKALTFFISPKEERLSRQPTPALTRC